MTISAWRQAAVALALCLAAATVSLVLLTVGRLQEVEQLRVLAHENRRSVCGFIAMGPSSCWTFTVLPCAWEMAK